MSNSERRRAQNRRAQANLRRKQREHIEDLQQQILSLKAQAQTRTEDQLQAQSVDHKLSGEIPEYYDSHNSFQANTEDIPSYLIDEELSTDDLSVSVINPLTYIQQFPNPPCPSSSTPKSPVTLEFFHHIDGSTSGKIIPGFQQYYCAFDALAENALLLGISPESFLSTHSNSIFYSPLQSIASISASIKHLPSEFHPTMAQLSYPHQPWIDCIPLRDLRSRIIYAVSHSPPFLDGLDLWHDVLSDGLTCIVDPKDALSWNMSDDFVQRWQMLLRIDLMTLETMCLASNPPVRKISLPDP